MLQCTEILKIIIDAFGLHIHSESVAMDQLNEKFGSNVIAFYLLDNAEPACIFYHDHFFKDFGHYVLLDASPMDVKVSCTTFIKEDI